MGAHYLSRLDVTLQGTCRPTIQADWMLYCKEHVGRTLQADWILHCSKHGGPTLQAD